MTIQRLEVRLDSQHGGRLAAIVAERGRTASEVIRELIDKGYEQMHRARRRKAADRIAGFQVEDVPEPKELSRQLEATHAIPDLY